MKCPVCKEAQLVMSDRQGIEIDYCPECRGVWLDRGELDKIIERSETREPARDTPPRSGNYSDYDHRRQGSKPYKKKSFLSELFD